MWERWAYRTERSVSKFNVTGHEQVLTLRKLKKETQQNRTEPFWSISNAISQNVAHNLEPDESPSNSASYQAPNYNNFLKYCKALQNNDKN